MQVPALGPHAYSTNSQRQQCHASPTTTPAVQKQQLACRMTWGGQFPGVTDVLTPVLSNDRMKLDERIWHRGQWRCVPDLPSCSHLRDSLVSILALFKPMSVLLATGGSSSYAPIPLCILLVEPVQLRVFFKDFQVIRWRHV